MRFNFAFSWLVPLSIACTGTTDTDADDTDPTDVGVMKDCAPAEGRICPLYGTGDAGFNGDGLLGIDSWFSLPMSVNYSPYGDPVIADWNNHKLRLVQSDGTLRTIMGTSFIGDGDFDGFDMVEGAQGTAVNLNHPTQQRYFSSGILLSASWHTHKLRTWDPFTGIVRVLVGGAYAFTPPETEPPGEAQSAVGMQLNQPRWVEIDSHGDVYVVDMRNERIRKLAMQEFEISTVAGSGKYGVVGTIAGDPPVDCTSEDALQTCFKFPMNMNPEPGGAIQLNADETLMYIADSEANVIRVLDMATRQVTVVAGSPGVVGDTVGEGSEARFAFPSSIALDNDTNTLFVADTDNHRVKAIDLTTGMVSNVAGTGEPTCPSDFSAVEVVTCPEQHRAGDGGPAADAMLFRPFGVDLDLNGNLVIADTFDHRFRIVYR